MDPLETKTSADIYVFEINEDDDSAAANVLRMVGKAKRVLEIGAGPGSIARPLVQRNKCRLTAVELDPHCVPILQQFCDRVVMGDLNSEDWIAALESEKFDVVVIADVLEHLVNPWRTLRMVTGLLRSDGYVVCSIPNASHATILAAFGDSNVDYRNWGLLDRTHIRFFGVKNVQSLFSQAGLKITRANYVVRNPVVTEFADLWRSLNDDYKRVYESGPFSHVYQTVVEARLASDPRPEFILMEHPPSKSTVKVHPYHALLPTAVRRKLAAAARSMLGEHGKQRLKRLLGL